MKEKGISPISIFCLCGVGPAHAVLTPIPNALLSRFPTVISIGLTSLSVSSQPFRLASRHRLIHKLCTVRWSGNRPFTEVAPVLGCHPSNVSRALQKSFDELVELGKSDADFVLPA
jgi:hypothetical protein